MYKHHEETIANITEKLKRQESVLAVILSGSIAHHFESETSDVDIMIVIPDEEYSERTASGETTYYEKESCTYEEGYIDGKYIGIDFMKQVSLKGSEPARFAFDGAQITYSKIKDLDKLLQQIAMYPVERKKENIGRFYAQLEAWKWFCEEGIKYNNPYLLTQAVSNFVLFSGRLILAHNEVLYPFHKWFIQVLRKVENKPENLMKNIDTLLRTPNKNNVENLYQSINNFREWEISELRWPNIFMKDSELNWIGGNTPIGDI
jgi:hypothetical protein